MYLFLEIALRAALVVGTIIALTRLHGLRSFSKMSGFDFAITVSIGSVLAGAVTTLGTGVWIYIAALAALFGIQVLIAQARARWSGVERAIDNPPVLLMENGEMLRDNMRKCGVSPSDLWAKLREANAYDLDTVRAVVMESTGDVSVLHGPSEGPDISSRVMQDVVRT